MTTVSDRAVVFCADCYMPFVSETIEEACDHCRGRGCAFCHNTGRVELPIRAYCPSCRVKRTVDARGHATRYPLIEEET